MAVAFDAVSHPTPGVGNLSWTHTPSGTPKGVLVTIVQNADGTDQVSGVTYGGVTMTELPSSPVLHNTGEVGAAYGYFLGANIPTGAQTVVVTVTGGAFKHAECITVTAGDNTEVINDEIINNTGLVDPSVTVALSGRTCFVAQAFYTAIGIVTNMTPRSGWTAQLEYDFGTECAGFYTYDTIGSADVIAGYSASQEDVALIAVAISEVSAVAKVSTLITTFPGTSLPAPFADYSGGGSATVSGGRLVLDSGDAASEYGYASTYPTLYNLDEDSIYLPFIPGVDSTFVVLVIDSTLINGYLVGKDGANWVVYRFVAGTPTSIFSVAYNAGTMRWVKIREAAGVVHFETAAGLSTPGSFTDRFSEATNTNASFNHTQIVVALENIFVTTANDKAYVSSVNAGADIAGQLGLHKLNRGIGSHISSRLGGVLEGF